VHPMCVPQQRKPGWPRQIGDRACGASLTHRQRA
jgi:hypothetical protein